MRSGRQHYPDDEELLWLEGRLCVDLGDLAGAEAALRRLLGGAEGEHLGSTVAGLRELRGRDELAKLYLRQGRLGDAESLWRRAVQAEADFVPGWAGLGEVCLAQGRWDELEVVLQRLARSGAALQAELLRARALFSRKEFAEARRLVEPAVAAHPQVLDFRELLCDVLMGCEDWPAAERAFRELLALAPQHRNARTNLDVVLRRLGPP